MPQIKFSGLVTDMKGKAGGSVFSSNKQGSYMRNNKWGGGRKSNRWDLSKSKLSALANSWRLLNAEQQEAWNTSAKDFPFTNKFGEQYIGSGYQVYMSLNGNLLANGFPLLTTPGANRALPEDLDVSFSQPTPPWVTAGTGATFPAIPNSQTQLCNNSYTCPAGFECRAGQCVAIYQPGTAEFNKLQQDIKDVFYIYEPLDCTSDQDCVDQGLTGASADVECQNGECVYVGDGVLSWNNQAFVLDIVNTLYDGGQWTHDTDISLTTVSTSFRFTLGAKSKALLRTSIDDIVLMSSYQYEAPGISIRLRKVSNTTTRLFLTYGIWQNNNRQSYCSLVWYIDVNTSELMSNCVLQLQFSPTDTETAKFALNNSGWVTPQFEYYENALTEYSQYWGNPAGTNHNPFPNWIALDYWWGFVYGAGIFGAMNDVVYGDIRFYSEAYDDYLYPLVGYLNGFETILILANGDAKPKCNYVGCAPPNENACSPKETCTCRHSICGTWGQRDRWNDNKAPGGDTSIALMPAVPVFSFVALQGGDTGVQFANYWLNLDGCLYGNNGATYVPNPILSVQAPQESGWVICVSVSSPVAYNSDSRWNPLRLAGQITTYVNADWNLWEYIKGAIVNAPPGTSFDVGISYIDTQSGLARPKVKKRFKAGADLSSSVN